MTFPVTDNRHWVQMRRQRGPKVAYLKDFSTIVSDGEELSATDVFNNLVIGGLNWFAETFRRTLKEEGAAAPSFVH